MLKAHDIVICVLLVRSRDASVPPTFAGLAKQARISASEAHGAVARAVEAGLLRKSRDESRTMPIPVLSAFEEFLVHGLKYCWPAKRGVIGRGLPTGSSLASVAESLDLVPPEQTLVWAHPEGPVRGETIEPLYPRAVEAALADPELHHWLALIDVIRTRVGREGALAVSALHRLLTLQSV